jgi:hypothetical protein
MKMQAPTSFLKASKLVLLLWAISYSAVVQSQSAPVAEENYLVLPATTYTIPFIWQGDSINAKWEPYTAFLIPVKLPNCTKQFYMQFDLGSPYSLFYKNKLASIQAKFPASIKQNIADSKLTNFSFKAGKVEVLATEIVNKQFDSIPINWSNKNGIEIIGTLGADFIDNKTMIIDYPNKRMTISNEIPKKLKAKLTLTDFVYASKSILLPAKVSDKETLLFFDTGSSMYELLTNKSTALLLAEPNAPVSQSKVNSWGTSLIANTVATKDSIELSGLKIPIHYATYIEGMSTSKVEQMMQMGIGGMTGNKLFLNYKLVLDTRNKKFGLIHSR